MSTDRVKRISFLNKKIKRSKFHKINTKINSSENDDESDSSSEVFTENFKNRTTHFKSDSEIHIQNIHDNSQTNEKIFLLKNSTNFCLIGKGKLRLVHGKINLFGYEISSENDLDDYDFDISMNHQLYECNNIGEEINSEKELTDLYKNLEKFAVRFVSRPNNLSLINNKISIIYFKEISSNFRIMNQNDLFLHTKLVKFNRYEKYINDYQIEENKKMIICGKKNSGKSTFILFLTNYLLSKIKNTIRAISTRQTHPFIFIIDCDSGQPFLSSPYNVTFLKINKPIFCNYYKENQCEIIRSILVEENSPSNNFNDYLRSVKSLSDYFLQIPNYNSHYLIVNTNGYTSGLGNVINSSIVETFKPDAIFYLKNTKAGRKEKGEEFENYILNEEEKENMEIILREYKIEKQQIFKGRSTNLEKNVILVENSFDLDEEKNERYKNIHKNLCIYANILGDKFSQNSEDQLQNEKDSYSINELIFSKNKNLLPLVEIPFDDFIFCFNFSEFKPKNDLDILLSLNSKMCFILMASENCISITEKPAENELLKILNMSNINISDRNFFCFGFIFNINIFERKIIILSNYLKTEYAQIRRSTIKYPLIIYRNASGLDKCLRNTKESQILPKLLSAKNFSPSINIFKNKEKNYSFKKAKSLHYYIRNKFSII